jgi:uncharacterized C2H2 Zn-finger protein
MAEIPGQEDRDPMAQTLVASLKKLARDKRRLKEMGRAVARAEQQVIDRLGRTLAGVGYRFLPIGGDHQQAGGSVPVTTRARVKRFRCPTCGRRFPHPLPMARHMSATHGTKRRARKARMKTAKK